MLTAYTIDLCDCDNEEQAELTSYLDDLGVSCPESLTFCDRDMLEVIVNH